MSNQKHPPKRRRGDKIVARRGRQRRPSWQLWTGIAVLIAAVVAGVVIQSNRSTGNAAVVNPAHVLGPGGGEQRGSASAPVRPRPMPPSWPATRASSGPTWTSSSPSRARRTPGPSPPAS